MAGERQDGLHVAIIMDGNGRWAARRGLPRAAGHRAGVAAARRVVECAPEVGIGRLTLYAFSADNWLRPAAEVQSIFWLLRAFLRLETERMRQRGVRLAAIGRRDRLPGPVLKEIEKTEHATVAGRRLDLRVAIDYSSRDAIAHAAIEAARAIAQSARSGARAASFQALFEEEGLDSLGSLLKQAMMAEAGDVDLLIRTGGEKRLSDFLLWESAYSELLFTDRMWPDFDEDDLEAALQEFRHRERRFGGVPEAACSMAGV